MKDFKTLLKNVISLIIDNPNNLEIKETSGERIVILSIYVPKEERGKIIGKGGATIRAIRQIFSVLGKKEGKRVEVEIIE